MGVLVAELGARTGRTPSMIVELGGMFQSTRASQTWAGVFAPSRMR